MHQDHKAHPVANLARRDMLRGAALLSVALGLPVRAFASEASGVSPLQLALLRRVAQTVIPATDTPGGGDVPVAEFVVLALRHAVDDDGQQGHLDWLERTLGADFTTLTPAQQTARLLAVDLAAFPPGPPPPGVPSPWRRIKGLILTGYYTSEVGASRELQYDLVPGRFDPDLPLHPGDRAWSSDWTALDFG